MLSRSLFIATAVTTLTLYGCSTTPLQDDKALILANCPELTELSDDSFGATTMKLVEVANQYHKCRKAAGVDDGRD